jgi:hypothetical protein
VAIERRRILPDLQSFRGRPERMRALAQSTPLSGARCWPRRVGCPWASLRGRRAAQRAPPPVHQRSSYAVRRPQPRGCGAGANARPPHHGEATDDRAHQMKHDPDERSSGCRCMVRQSLRRARTLVCAVAGKQKAAPRGNAHQWASYSGAGCMGCRGQTTVHRRCRMGQPAADIQPYCDAVYRSGRLRAWRDYRSRSRGLGKAAILIARVPDALQGK